MMLACESQFIGRETEARSERSPVLTISNRIDPVPVVNVRALLVARVIGGGNGPVLVPTMTEPEALSPHPPPEPEPGRLLYPTPTYGGAGGGAVMLPAAPWSNRSCRSVSEPSAYGFSQICADTGCGNAHPSTPKARAESRRPFRNLPLLPDRSTAITETR